MPEMNFQLPPYWIHVRLCLISMVVLTITLFGVGVHEFSKSFQEENCYDSNVVAYIPLRILLSVVISLVVSIYAHWKKSVSLSGAIVGFFVGFILSFGSGVFLASLLTFFFSSSQATKYRSDQKKLFEENFSETGNRNWIQVLCNGGMPSLLAIIYILDCGCGERLVDFNQNYHASWLSMAILGSIASACGDTWSSEIGSVLSSGTPVLITTFRSVPRGTNGGITPIGVWCSFLGGLWIGFAYYTTTILFVDTIFLERGPPQWQVIIVGGLAGMLGSILDSYLGAIFQYSGLQADTGKIVSRPGKGVVHISGRNILDNHSVNLITNITMGLIVPLLANVMYSRKFWICASLAFILLRALAMIYLFKKMLIKALRFFFSDFHYVLYICILYALSIAYDYKAKVANFFAEVFRSNTKFLEDDAWDFLK